ncbi:hypothetical protein PIIN_03864 [Serendipita indica DSM 11827]|uniref:Uncharacterized protein n=1 Tax=Serendipita indica (strain DSM 11827) TaxID=1109443 RepID=G4TF29_SERID|nr:hypothetical protein PIIN_03864 [Serendipita indica DSM 11827]
MKWTVLALFGVAALVRGQDAILPCATVTKDVYTRICPQIRCAYPSPTTLTQTVVSTRTITVPTTCPPLTPYPPYETMKKREPQDEKPIRPHDFDLLHDEGREKNLPSLMNGWVIYAHANCQVFSLYEHASCLFNHAVMMRVLPEADLCGPRPDHRLAHSRRISHSV